MRAARELGDSAARSDRAGVARTVLQLSESLPYVPSGPLWYRGVSNESERLERGSVDSALHQLGADLMVVGHTPTASGRINSRFAGRVFRIDVGMAYGRQPLALVFERAEIKVYDPATGSYGPYVVEPPTGEGVAHFSEQLPDEQLLDFLRTASITGCAEERDGVRFAKICDLESKELHLRAVFQSIDEQPGNVAEEPRSVPRTYRNEIAAYRLDRILGIGMLPATVERAVEGVPGSLQIWLDAAVDLPLLETYDKMELLTGLETQIIRAEAFMAVMDVHAAHPTIGVMLLPRERRLQIADVTKAFSLSSELNPQLMTPPCPKIGAEQELYLRSITAQQLEKELGGYLSAVQIEALLARRDRFLDICTGRPVESTGS